MTKNKKSLFNFEELETEMYKADLRITRLVWFAAGFVAALTILFIALLSNGK